VIHISAAGDHTDLPVMFAGFMVVATLQIALGATLLLRPPSRLLVGGAVAMMLSSIGLWVLSRTAGLPFIEGGHLEPIGFKDGVTKLFEIGSIPALLLLLSPDLARVSLPSRRLGSQAMAMVGAGCFALMTPALLLGGGEQHTHEEAVALGIHDHDSGHDELAHADGARSAHAHREGAETSRGHDHANRSNHAHHNAHTELASTRGANHAHASPDQARHEHGDSQSDNEEQSHEHAGGDHDKGAHKRGGHKDGDHGHGHGKHGGDQPDEGPGDQPVTISYEPQPSICLADICVP
jgi:hypothetical protein